MQRKHRTGKMIMAVILAAALLTGTVPGVFDLRVPVSADTVKEPEGDPPVPVSVKEPEEDPPVPVSSEDPAEDPPVPVSSEDPEEDLPVPDAEHEIELSVTCMAPADGSICFERSAVFRITAVSHGESGIERVVYEAVDENSVIVSGNKTGETDQIDSDFFQEEIRLGFAPGREAQILLSVTAYDKAGRQEQNVTSFDIDTAAPEISQPERMTQGERITAKDGKTYYTDAMSVSFYVTDQNLAGAQASFRVKNILDGTESDGEAEIGEIVRNGGTKQQQILLPVRSGQQLLSYSVKAFDAAGTVHMAARSEKNLKEIVYSEAPEAAVSLSEGEAACSTADGTDYYDGEVTVQVSVYDPLLETAEAVFTLETEKEPRVVALTHADTDPAFVYTGRLTLQDTNAEPGRRGDVLEKIRLNTERKTGFARAVTPAAEEAEEGAAAGSIAVYEDGRFTTVTGAQKIAVDVNKPEIEIDVPYEQAVNSRKKDGKTTYYFDNDTQEIIIRVCDANLDLSNTYAEYTTEENGSAREPVKAFFTEEMGDGPVYTMTIRPEADLLYRDLKVYAVDYTGSRKNESRNEKAENDRYITDTKKPELSFLVRGEGVESFFAHDEEIYVKFRDPAFGESGQPSEQKEEKISLQVFVKDRNLEIDPEAGYDRENYVLSGMAGPEKWRIADGNQKIGINKDTTVVFSKELTVQPDTTGWMKFAAAVRDLAGHAPERFAAEEDPTNTLEAAAETFSFDAGTGAFSGTITADRCRPSGSNESNPPVIVMNENTAAAGSVVHASGQEVKLYAGSMSYHVTVTDPQTQGPDGKMRASGLQAVFWTVETDREGLIGSTGGSLSPEGALSCDFQVPVAVSGSGESDNVTVALTAVDLAGNRTTCRRHLAIDNEAPRVRVSYDNNAARNGRYFNEERLLTLRVEDLHFNPDGTPVSTQPGFSGWHQEGNVFTGTLRYDTDGDYTFRMDAADLAGNQARIDYTDGGRNVSPQAFTIDRTAPVIGVSFDNNDVRCGRYYRADRTASVVVTERNFDASGVRTAVSASLDGQTIRSPRISAFSGDGETHSAVIPFHTDGDYSFTVEAVDLAGNTARGIRVGTFTVDKTAPAVRISGISGRKAYTGSVRPQVVFEDLNFDPDGCRIVWYAERIDGKTENMPEASVSEIPHGRICRFENPEEIVQNDGIYTLCASVSDLAGNRFQTEPVVCSINRFGSVYTVYDRATGVLLRTGYTGKKPALRILETNPDRLTFRSVSISVNGAAKTLQEGRDFAVSFTGSGKGWKQYIYEIPAEAFEDSDGNPVQGEYVVTLYSEDGAGNQNSNRTNPAQNSQEIRFTLDCDPPTGYINVTGLMEAQDFIPAQTAEAAVYWEDNTGVRRVEILQNGRTVEILEGEKLAQAGGSWTATIKEADRKQSIGAVLTDLAGNVTVLDSVSFYLHAGGIRSAGEKKLPAGWIAAAAAAAVFFAGCFAVKKRKQRNRSRRKDGC